jgi:hypothetical protein
MILPPKTTKRKPIAEKTQRELEKTLDRIFSEYIRLRDADDNGYCKCVTCGNTYHWKEIHNGHFIGRANKAVRYNEINCHCQCVRCNSHRQGEHHLYRLYLVNRYGKEAVERLEYEAMLGGSYDRFWLQQKITEYREKVRRLKAEKGLR